MTTDKNKKSMPSAIASKVLLRPRMTEKAHFAISLGKYVFQVTSSATKQSIKQSIENIYGVSVTAVNIVSTPRKRRVFGRSIGWKSAIKKAVVTLKKGESIDLFKGV